MISDLYSLSPLIPPRLDWSLMKFVNEIIRSLRAFMRKTGALLSTTFVLSLHTVFHNVIWNWCNRAVQFLSIIVLSCPLQPCSAHVHGRPSSLVYFHEFYEYSSKPKGLAMSSTVTLLSADRPRGSFQWIFPQYAKTRKHAGTLDLDYRRSFLHPGNWKGPTKYFAV